jgi:hypothetical protein
MKRPYLEAYRSKLDTSLYMPTYSVSMVELGAKRGCFGAAESENDWGSTGDVLMLRHGVGHGRAAARRRRA